MRPWGHTWAAPKRPAATCTGYPMLSSAPGGLVSIITSDKSPLYTELAPYGVLAVETHGQGEGSQPPPPPPSGEILATVAIPWRTRLLEPSLP